MFITYLFQMYKDCDSKRPEIIPSARPSIHNHNYSSSYSGLSKKVVTSKMNVNDEKQNLAGIDELDNIMSKFSKNQTSPHLRRKQSIDIESDNSLSDYTDDKIFSKSLPAYLPSHLNCSEVSPAKSIESSPKYSKINSKRIRKTNSPQCSDNSFDSSSGEKNTFRYLIISILVATCGYVSYKYIYEIKPSPKYVYNESTFYNDLNNIGHKYGISANSVLRIQTGISAIFEKEDAGSFIFVYNSNKHNYKPVELHKFMEALAVSTTRYLRNESESVEPVVDITYKNIESDTELMIKYREDVSKTGVMLVKEVDNVPSSLAMAFHYYCDEYNPLVKKSAIFFTLDMAKCSTTTADQKPNQSFVERCLAQKWTTVPKDNIGPLLTRVVDIVVDITTLK